MSELRFDGKIVLITGTVPGGLGHAYAKLMASRGASVVVNDLGVDWAGNKGEPGAATVAEERVEQFGRLDVLINNAGSGGDFDTMPLTHVAGTYGQDSLQAPPSMWGAVRMLAERIGPDAVAELDAIDFSMLGGL